MSRRARGTARSELLSSALLAACAVCSSATAVYAAAGGGLSTIDAGVTVRRRRPVPLRIECSERNKEDEENGRTKQKSARRRVRFSHEEVYLFHRALGVDVVPATGEICLGMEPWHHSEERRTLTSSTSIASEREEQGATPAARKPSTRSSPRRQPAAVNEEEDEGRERRSMQPLDDKLRGRILKASGVKLPKAKKSALGPPSKEGEELELEAIRQRRRASCGCSCSADAGCDPATCACSRDGVHCQVDTKEVGGSSFPCACASIDCKNPKGRLEFSELLVRAHNARTLARLRLGDAIERTVDHRQDG